MNEKADTGRALVVTQLPRGCHRGSGSRPEAAHLAHLLAMRHDAEQFRGKRRAAPATAIGAYGAAGSQMPVRRSFDGRA